MKKLFNRNKKRKPMNLRTFLFRVFVGIIAFSFLGYIITLFFPRDDSGTSLLSQNAVDKSEYWDNENGTTAEDIEYESEQSRFTSSFSDEYASVGVKPAVAKISKNGWNLILLNKNYILPDNYELNLKNITGSALRLESVAAEYFDSMYLNASKEGITLTPYSAYRSFASQRRMFENKLYELELTAENEYLYGGYYDEYGNYVEPKKKDSKTIGAEVLKEVAVPGCSCHNAGLAVDIVSQNTDFEETKEYKWLCENAAEYGFVLRFPKDKEKVTGVSFKPYCWRFVGVSAAKEMKKDNLCLEEYLSKVL